MVKRGELIDDLIEKKEPVLCSRLSIFLLSILTSPLLGGVLYCWNLYKTSNKQKVFGAYISIALANFFVVIPFFGFSFGIHAYSSFFHLNNIAVALFIIFPLWNIHFGNLKFDMVFPWKKFLILTFVYIGYTSYVVWLNSAFSYFEPVPVYLPKPTYMTSFQLIGFAITIKLVVDIIKWIKNIYLLRKTNKE